MIEFLCGRLLEKSPSRVVVQTGGIAFSLPISLTSYDALPPPGSEVTLFTLLVVREDSLTLFGFASAGERKLFEQLTQVTGIGPKLALAALSGLSGGELKRAIAEADIKRLSGISGIGRKTAERMVVELRDKIGEADLLELKSRGEEIPRALRDAILALVALGYKQRDAQRMLEAVPAADQPGLPVEELVRRALAGS